VSQQVPTNPYGVYLAGKISENDWRHEFVPGLRFAFSEDEYLGGNPWPSLSMPGGLTYVGPFFTNDHTGVICNGDHAVVDQYADLKDRRDGRRNIVRRCLSAIDEAQFVVAVITNDAHGTIAEVGYAVALGKTVIITPGRNDAGQPFHGDAWFPAYMPGVYWVSDINEALEWVRKVVWFRQSFDLCESPIERALWGAMGKENSELINSFRPQVTVGRYRLDFADPNRKLAIEADGHEFHSSKEQFTKDRQRQRDLELDGWRFIRFSGAEINADAGHCAKQILKWIETIP
jgi:very-short-patch-repair endonuclease